MANIKAWLQEAEKSTGETIEAVVVGAHYKRLWDADKSKRPDENIVLSRDAGLAKLDEDFDNGYGGADCYPMYAWSKSWVYCVHEYDGATSLVRLPRSPINCEPEFGGSGE